MFRFSFSRIAIAAGSAVAGLALLGGAVFAWTGHVENQPTGFGAGSADGFYLWHNHQEDRFHLRTTDSAGHFKYTGVLRTNGAFEDVELVRAEPDDHVKVSPDHHTITFAFVTAEGIDGIDFNVRGGTRVGLALDRDGKLIDPTSIFLGENSVHPKHNPFRIHRDRKHRHQWANDGSSAGSTRAPTASGS